MSNKDQVLLINQFCDEFESQLKSGGDPSIDKVLESAKSEVTDEQVLQTLLSELIALEIVYSQDRLAVADSLRSRFPNQINQIDEALGQASLLGTVGNVGDETGAIGNAKRGVAIESIAKIGDRFENLRHYASGGLGDVYVGFDNAVRRQVAIKLLKTSLIGKEQAKQRFLNEGAITGTLEHPGIVPIYDSGVTEDGQPYYAMRLLGGKNLREAIDDLHALKNKSEFGERQRSLLRSLAQACDAIAYAHDRGVIHRDLKPANILLGDYGETVVVDWGLARAEAGTNPPSQTVANANRQGGDGGDGADQPGGTFQGNLVVTKMGRILGTPAYMSPEQAMGDSSKVGKQSDVYSLGSVLYCILTGSSPLGDQPALTREMIDSIQNAKYLTASQRKAGVPVSLNAICQRAMNVDPASRYSSPKELAADIENWLGDQPVVARPDSVLEKFSRFVRKYRGWSAAAAATLLAVTIGSSVAVAVINSQSAELSLRKSEAEKLAVVQTELAAEAKASEEEAIAANLNNSTYVRLMDKAFESLRERSFRLAKEHRNASIKDLVQEIDRQIEKKGDSIPAKTKRYLLGNMITGLNAAGEDEIALELTREYIDIVTEIHGKTSEAVLDAKGALVYSLFANSKYMEAVELAEETLELIRSAEIPPESQIRVGEIKDSVMNNRINSLQQLRRYDEVVVAREESDSWLSNLELNNLPANGEKLLLVSLYIDARVKAGQDVDSIAWQEKIYEAHEKVSGQMSPVTLGSLHRLTQAILRRDGAAAALPRQKTLVEKVFKVLGAEHQNYLTSKVNLADMMLTTGHYEDSLAHCREAREVLKNKENLLNNLLICETKIARGQLFLGTEKQALELIRTVVERAIADRNIGPLFQTSTNAKYLLFVALLENDEVEEAVVKISKEIDLLINSGNSKSIAVAKCWELLQLAWLKQGKYDSALELRQHFDEEVSNETIARSAQLAEALLGAKKFDEARELAEQVLELPAAEDERALIVARAVCMKAKMKGLLAEISAEADPDTAKQLYAEAISELENCPPVQMPNVRIEQPLAKFRKQLSALK